MSTASADLIDAVARLVRLLSRPRDLDVLAPLTIREILWLLITGEQGAITREYRRQFGLPPTQDTVRL